MGHHFSDFWTQAATAFCLMSYGTVVYFTHILSRSRIHTQRCLAVSVPDVGFDPNRRH